MSEDRTVEEIAIDLAKMIVPGFLLTPYGSTQKGEPLLSGLIIKYSSKALQSERDKIVEAEARYKELEAQVKWTDNTCDGLCYYCGKMTDRLAGNPSNWPMNFPHQDDPGKVKPHHTSCVLKELRRIKELETKIEQLKSSTGTNNLTTITPPEVLHAEYKRGFDDGYENGELRDDEYDNRVRELKDELSTARNLLKFAKGVDIEEGK